MPPFGAVLTFFRRRRWHFLSLCSRPISSSNRASRSFDREFLRRWPFFPSPPAPFFLSLRSLSFSRRLLQRPFAHVREFPFSLRVLLSRKRGLYFKDSSYALRNRFLTDCRPGQIVSRRSELSYQHVARFAAISDTLSNPPSLHSPKRIVKERFLYRFNPLARSAY